jgi:hypothetical protein
MVAVAIPTSSSSRCSLINRDSNNARIALSALLARKARRRYKALKARALRDPRNAASMAADVRLEVP